MKDRQVTYCRGMWQS